MLGYRFTGFKTKRKCRFCLGLAKIHEVMFLTPADVGPKSEKLRSGRFYLQGRKCHNSKTIFWTVKN